jgi:hypothetical protein
VGNELEGEVKLKASVDASEATAGSEQALKGIYAMRAAGEETAAQQIERLRAEAAEAEATKQLTDEQVALASAYLGTTEAEFRDLEIGTQRVALSRAKAAAVNNEIAEIRGSAMAEAALAAEQATAAETAEAEATRLAELGEAHRLAASTAVQLEQQEIALIASFTGASQAQVRALSDEAKAVLSRQAHTAAIKGEIDALAASVPAAAASAAATGEDAAAKGAATFSSRELGNAENVLTFSRGRAARAAIDEAAATLGAKEALAAAAPVVVALAAGGFALNSVFTALNARGLEIPGWADLSRAAMDALSASFGGISLSAAEAEQGFEKGAAAADKTGASLLTFRDKEQLASAAGVDLKAIINAVANDLQNPFRTQLDSAAPGLSNLESAARAASVELDVIATNARKLQLYDPARLNELLAQLRAIPGSGDGAAKKLGELTMTFDAAGKEVDTYLKGIDKISPAHKNAAGEFGDLSAKIQGVAAGMVTLRTEGKSEGEIWQILGPQIRSTANEASLFEGTVKALPPGLHSWAVALLEAAKDHDPLIEKMQKLDEQAHLENESFKALEKGLADLGKRNIDAAGQASIYGDEIIRQRDALLRVKDATGALSTQQEAELDELQNLIKEMNLEETAEEKVRLIKVSKSKAIYDVVEALEKERQKHVEALATIIATAAQEKLTIQQQTKDSVDAIDRQIDAIRSRDHTDTASKDLLDDLETRRKQIREAALTEQIRVDSQAAASSETESKRDVKAKDDIFASIDKLIRGEGTLSEKLVVAQGIHDEYTKHVGLQTKAINDADEAAAKSAAAQVAAALLVDSKARPLIKDFGDEHGELSKKALAAALKIEKDVTPKFITHGTNADHVKNMVKAAADAHDNFVKSPGVIAVADPAGPVGQGSIRFAGLNIELGRIVENAPNTVKALNDIAGGLKLINEHGAETPGIMAAIFAASGGVGGTGGLGAGFGGAGGGIPGLQGGAPLVNGQ